MSLTARPLSLSPGWFTRARQSSLRLLGHGAVLASLAVATAPVGAQVTAPPAAGRATLTGVVKDVATGAPVVGVVVRVPGFGAQVLTNDAGRYTIPGLSLGSTVSIEAQRVGYGQTRLDGIRMDQATVTKDFTVNANALSLEAVTSSATTDPITGVKIPFAMSKLDAEQMPVPNLSNAAGSIQGKVAGVVMTSMSGAPGDTMAVQIRAIMSPFKNNSPLYVVDGVPLTNTDFTSGDFLGLDIENVEVIRGAAAASLYGSRASGGVISITTKRSKDLALGSSQIEARQDFGWEDIIQMPPFLTSHRYYQNKALQWTNTLGVVVSKGSRVGEAVPMLDNQYAVLYNPIEQALVGNRSMTSRVSISQNSATTTLNVSYSRNRTPGVSQYNEGQLQQNVRFFIGHQLRDNLSLEATAQHTRGRTRDAQTSFSDLFSWEPDVNLFMPNRTSVVDTDFPYALTPDSASSDLSPMYREYRTQNYTKRQRTLVSTDLQYRPFNWINIRASLGYDKSDNGYDRFQPAGIPSSDTQVSTGSLAYQDNFTDGLSADIFGTILKDIGRLTTKLTLRGHQERQTNVSYSASGTNFAAGLATLQSAANVSISSSVSDSRINSGSINLGADYAGRYIFDGLLLHEGNSRFGPDKRWNDYFRLAGSWLLSEEPWYPSFLSKLTLAKVRYSYGTAGNQPSFSDQYENVQVSSTVGYLRDVLGNPDLKPEMKYDHEMGADFIWNNKVSFQFTYARSELHDAIVANVAPAVSGYNTNQGNIGVTRGETFEGTVEGTWVNTRIRGKNFRWFTNFVTSHSTSTLVDLGRPCYGVLTYHPVCDNVPVTEIWGHVLMKTLDDLTEHAPSFTQYRDQWEVNDDGYLVAVGKGNHWWEGTSKNLWGTTLTFNVGNPAGQTVRVVNWGIPQVQWVDTIGGINTRQWEKLGDSQQLFDFGFGNRFTYGSLSAYVHFRGAIGGTLWNEYYHDMLLSDRHPVANQYGKADSLKKPTWYYRGGAPGGQGFDGLSINNDTYAYSNNMREQNWAKLGELALTYSMNNRTYRFLNKMGAERLNVSIIGRDLYTFKGNYDGQDPEGFSRRGDGYFRYDSFRYPPTRKYSGTVTIVF